MLPFPMSWESKYESLYHWKWAKLRASWNQTSVLYCLWIQKQAQRQKKSGPWSQGSWVESCLAKSLPVLYNSDLSSLNFSSSSGMGTITKFKPCGVVISSSQNLWSSASFAFLKLIRGFPLWSSRKHKTPYLRCRWHGFVPVQGSRIPHCAQNGPKYVKNKIKLMRTLPPWIIFLCG